MAKNWRWRQPWRGKQVAAATQRAAAAGIDETTGAAVNAAKSDHGWANRTGTAEGSIQMRPAKIGSTRITGQWGSFDVDYFLFLELGTAFMEGDDTLRRAADTEYPRLAGRVRSNMRGG